MWISLKLLTFMTVNVSLTYDPTRKPDGVGAQLQRILAIYGLCNITKLKYSHTGISDVAVHALDPYQNMAEYQRFLAHLNSIFALKSSEVPTSRTEILVQHFRTRTLIYYSLLSILKRRHFLLRISEPYAITDSVSNIYSFIHPLQDELKDFMAKFKVDSPTIAIHYRWGVGGKQIQQGESTTRELDVTYYAKVIKHIKSVYPETNFKIVVVTDAPDKSLIYEPPSKQSSLWLGSPGFNAERNTINVSGMDMRMLFKNLEMEVEVKSGGNPMEAIAVLANADHVILSRSSLSFVSGLISKSEVYFPISFWHRPLKSWHLINDENLV